MADLACLGFILFPFIGNVYGRVITKKNQEWFDVSNNVRKSHSNEVCGNTTFLFAELEETLLSASKMGISSGLDIPFCYNGLRFLLLI